MKGEKTQIVIPVDALSTPNQFSKLVENQGNFVTQWNPKQFSQLKEYLFEIEKKAQEITVLGFQSDTKYWAWANGILANGEFHPVDEAGIVEVAGKYYYIPAYSVINADSAEGQEERKFIYKEGQLSFSQWAKLFVKVYGDKGKIGILFLVATFFRDIIFKHVGSFPMLFLFGMKGSGKSAFRTSLKSLYGNYTESDAMSLEGVSTPKAYQRKLAQIRNGIEILRSMITTLMTSF
ncbi:MAG: hypothetical protein IPN74_20210 [Haliscomenobacter sp.]|nr:hypothetical protein [Haliscomenobacter sp.]